MKTPQVLQYTAVLSSYSKGDAPAFNSAVDDYRATQIAKDSARTNRADFEAWFNSFAPFYQCLILYVVVFVLAKPCRGWFSRSRRSIELLSG